MSHSAIVSDLWSLSYRGSINESLWIPWVLQNRLISRFLGSPHQEDIWIQHLAKGDQSAFNCLFSHYGDLVFGYCLKLLQNRDRAEDASQEVWVKVLKSAHRYEGRGRLRAWLLQITRNTCFNFFRDQKKNRAEDLSDVDVDVEDFTQDSVLNTLTEAQNIVQLKQHIQDLPDNQRMALMIWMTEELSYEEIAAQLQLSVSAVKSLLFRARQTLKEKLGAQ